MSKARNEKAPAEPRLSSKLPYVDEFRTALMEMNAAA
jgi:hypothetical protein